MRIGRLVGYGLLALVDAAVATVVAVVITGFGLLGWVVDAETAMTAALAVGAVTFALTLLASTVSHYRGGKPFAFTRIAKTVFSYWVWPPWFRWGQRRR